MNPDVPLNLMREGLTTLVTVGGPVAAVLMTTGLVLGVLQAATQVNDPAVGFVPRLVALLLMVWSMGGWMVEQLAVFLRNMLVNMGQPP
jgi:flagellar biosynthetic protein FliQ